ncbi:MAG: PhaM family polyhydroxyalkanoate granule multifunctional regulatory protein [Burkholderiaceae bacterium]
MTQGNTYGTGPMSDTLDFVKKLWGGMSVPGMPAMVAPTLSVEELEQKITDLKAVESWLNVNMSMLRNTIQAMEVQRATIGTLQSMSAAFQSAVDSSTEKKFDAATFWSSLQPEKSSPTAASAKAAEPEPVSAPPAPKATVSEPTELAAQMASPTAWWDILQNQFKQAVSNAIAEPETKAAGTTAAKTTSAARKPVAKSAAKPTAAAEKAPVAARKRKPAPKA